MWVWAVRCRSRCFCDYSIFFSRFFRDCLWFFMLDDHKSVLYVRDGYAGDDDDHDGCELFNWAAAHKHTECMSVLCVFACCKFPWFMRHSFHFNCQWAALFLSVKFFKYYYPMHMRPCCIVDGLRFVLILLNFLFPLLIIYRPRKLGWIWMATW